MYDVIHRRRANSVDNYVVIASGFLSMVDARNHREVSGDLVVNSETGHVVDSHLWLWDWERKDMACYAQRAREHDRGMAAAAGGREDDGV